MEQTLDLNEIKMKQQSTWATGNYSIVGSTLQIVGENLCEALDLQPGTKVLDVCAGNGNATLAAARRFGEVTSTDYVPELLAAGQRRAEAEGYEIKFQVADVENLPFKDGSFDFVVSTFGAMFSPSQETTASELLRVTKSGGRIGLANWTPAGFIGQMFKVIGTFIPPFVGLKSPLLWGTTERIDELFGTRASVIATSKNTFNFRYKSPSHFLDIFRTYYGPTNKAFTALADKDRLLLAQDILKLIENNNLSKNGTMNVPSEYLEVVIDVK